MQQAHISGETWHTGYTEKSFWRKPMRLQFLDLIHRCIEAFSPAKEALNKVAGLHGSIIGRSYLTNGTALHGRTEREWRNIALRVIHPAAHVGINGHPKIAYLNLSGSGCRQLNSR